MVLPEAGRGCGHRGGSGACPELSPLRLSPPPLHLASRVQEQLQSVQAQWTRVQERSEQKRRRLLASLQLQVRRPAQVDEASREEGLGGACCVNTRAQCRALYGLQSTFPHVLFCHRLP